MLADARSPRHVLPPRHKSLPPPEAVQVHLKTIILHTYLSSPVAVFYRSNLFSDSNLLSCLSSTMSGTMQLAVASVATLVFFSSTVGVSFRRPKFSSSTHVEYLYQVLDQSLLNMRKGLNMNFRHCYYTSMM